jgi:citrate lyase subunit beta/citryl-CoA lyase
MTSMGRMKARPLRSALFTPGTEAARLRKAVESGADVCIFDLEDSVPPGRIDEARGTVAAALEELQGRAAIWVRVHPASSPAMVEDVAALPLARADGIMIPKAGGAADVAAVRNAVRASQGAPELPLIPIIESAAGVLHAFEIATSPDVLCLAFGRFDLGADLGVDPDVDGSAVLAARAALVLSSTAAGLQRALDSPWVKIKDLDGLRQAAGRARSEGFGGMLLIHPSHVPIVNEAFSPTADEIAWARDIMASADRATGEGRGAYAREGAMVDEAIVRRARAILEEHSGAGPAG